MGVEGCIWRLARVSAGVLKGRGRTRARPPQIYALFALPESLLVGPLDWGEEGALAGIVEFNISMIDLHYRGRSGVPVIPDQPAAGENYMDLILFAGNRIDQRSSLASKIPSMLNPLLRPFTSILMDFR